MSNVIIKGGAGDDQIAASELDVGHNLTVDGGRGNDKMAASGDTSALSVAGNARIKGGPGSGKDTLSVEGDVTIDKRLTVKLGAGNDDLAFVEGAKLTATVKGGRVKGGPGKADNAPDPETLRTDGQLVGDKVKFTGFEDTNPVADDLATILAVVNGLIM